MRGIPRIDENAPSNAKGANQLVRQKFAKTLYAAIVAKGWTQAELARRAGVPRDRISQYIQANVLPTPPKMEAIAKALGVEVSELIPEAGEALAVQTAPLDAFSFKEVAPGKVRLQINKVVRLGTAMKIGQILNDDDAETSD